MSETTRATKPGAMSNTEIDLSNDPNPQFTLKKHLLQGLSETSLGVLTGKTLGLATFEVSLEGIHGTVLCPPIFLEGLIEAMEEHVKGLKEQVLKDKEQVPTGATVQ